MKINIILTFLLMLISIIFISSGEVVFGIKEILDFLFSDVNLTPLQKSVLFNLRLPRLISGILCGSALSISGLVFQSVLKNPLAEPYLLGVSSGGGLFHMIGMILGAKGFLGLGAFTFLGCIISLSLVIFLSRKFKGDYGTGMILSGVIIGAFFSAFSSFLSFLYSNLLPKVQIWMSGHIEMYDYQILAGLFVLLSGISIFIYCKSESLDILLLGEEHAYHMGINSREIMWKFLSLISILVAYTVSCFGMIGFIGLIVPHTIKKWVKGSHKNLVFPVLVSGSLMLLSADLIVQKLSFSGNIPVGLLTVMAGAPFFLYLFFIEKRSEGI